MRGETATQREGSFFLHAQIKRRTITLKNEEFVRLKFVFKVHTQSTQQKVALENQDFFNAEMPHPEWWTRGGTNRGENRHIRKATDCLLSRGNF